LKTGEKVINEGKRRRKKRENTTETRTNTKRKEKGGEKQTIRDRAGEKRGLVVKKKTKFLAKGGKEKNIARGMDKEKQILLRGGTKETRSWRERCDKGNTVGQVVLQKKRGNKAIHVSNKEATENPV